MRAFLFADLLQRTLRVVGGYTVHWVMNITDIDDKTIRDSAPGSAAWPAVLGQQSHDPKDNLKRLAVFYEQEFVRDISLLGIDLQHFAHMPRATDYILQMQELIRLIFDKGFAYISQGSIYFNVNAWRQHEQYGRLYTIDSEHFIAGVRIDADEYSREQVSDFVLWKGVKPGEPFWDFVLDNISLPGRPGWHIECSAMGHALLGLPFDIHTGGVDLRFPHHEDEIAQSKAGYGKETASFWCHNEFLEVEGRKMSKSAGNFFTLRDLVEKGLNPADIRFAMLGAHYASVYNFTFFGVESARKARERVQEYIYTLHETDNTFELRPDIQVFRNQIFAALSDNLHMPKALELLFSFMNENPAARLNEDAKKEMLQLFEELNQIFGVWSTQPRPVKEIIIPADIQAMAAERWQARLDRDFQKSDQLRAALAQAGYTVKDSKDGYTLEKA
jgi:cysteinyl-tRNA synthetase